MGGRVKTSFSPVLSIACARVYVTDNVNDAIDHIYGMDGLSDFFFQGILHCFIHGLKIIFNRCRR